MGTRQSAFQTNAFAGYSNDGGGAFIEAARAYNISLVATPVYKSGKRDMVETVRRLKASGCRGTVVFADTVDMVELLLESDKQQFDGVWLTADVIIADYSGTLRAISARHNNPLKVLRGVYAITFGDGRGFPRYDQFVEDWFVSSCALTTIILHCATNRDFCNNHTRLVYGMCHHCPNRGTQVRAGIHGEIRRRRHDHRVQQ